MTGVSYKHGDILKCPHCGKKQEEPVEDYPIEGKVGPASRNTEECVHCFKDFVVERLGIDVYSVTTA